jgi:hypothetical protein
MAYVCPRVYQKWNNTSLEPIFIPRTTFPFLAFPQTAVFYPLNLIFYILSITTALCCFIILHIFLAGFFMYILIRHWTVSRTPAFVSAIVLMFHGAVVSRLEFLSFISTIIWAPSLFYLFDNAIKKISLFYGIVF